MTPHEKEILLMRLCNISVRRIAELLAVSKGTIYKTLSNIRRKMK